VHKININTGMSVFKRAVGQLPQCRLQGTVVTLLSFSFWIFVFVLVFIDENHTATSPRTTDIIPVGETALLLAPSAEFL